MNVRSMQAVALLCALSATATAQSGDDSTGWTPRTSVGAAIMSSPLKRAVSGSTGSVSTSSASMVGGEFWAYDKAGSGVQLRYSKGTLDGPTAALSSGDLEYIDARVVIGSPVFAVVAGGLSRTSQLEGESRRFIVPRAGLQAGYYFAGTGIKLRVAGSYLRSIKEAEDDSLEAHGLEGETSILYVPPRFPVYVQLGYRRELWNVKREDLYIRREELGGLLLMVGVQTGLTLR